MPRPVIVLDPLQSYSMSMALSIPGKAVAPVKIAASVAAQSPPQLMFDLDEKEHEDLKADPYDPVVVNTLKSMFRPEAFSEVALHRNVMYAQKSANGCVYKMGSSLSRLGYAVRLTHSQARSGACARSFYSLQHTFLTIQSDGTEYIVDPAFKEVFLVHNPTDRLQSLLEAVPEVVMAPITRLVRAASFLSLELARCFKAQDVELPPWRKLRSALSRWEGAVKESSSLNWDAVSEVHGSAGFKLTPASSSPMAVNSPSSVLDNALLASSSPARYTRQYGFDVKVAKDECVCCGPRRASLRQQALQDFRRGGGQSSSAPAA